MRILYIEDDPDDRWLMDRVLKRFDGVELSYAIDGESARKEFEQPPTDLVILDLNLPQVSGQALLVEIRRHDVWCNVPVVVLTTSDDRSEIEAAYRACVNAYIVKPVSLEKFTDMINGLIGFWVTVQRVK